MAIKIPTIYKGAICVEGSTCIRPSDWAGLGDTLTLHAELARPNEDAFEVQEMFVPKEAYNQFDSRELAEKAPNGCYVLGTPGMKQIISISTEPHLPNTPWQKSMRVEKA